MGQGLTRAPVPDYGDVFGHMSPFSERAWLSSAKGQECATIANFGAAAADQVPHNMIQLDARLTSQYPLVLAHKRLVPCWSQYLD